MEYFTYITLLFGLLLHVSVEGCLLPLSSGTWISSTRGTWTVSENGTHSTISNFEADLTRSATTATLECKSSSGTQYILGTGFEIFFTEFIDVYICIDIRTTDVSPNSYVYYIATPTDSSTGEQFISNIDQACTNSDYETAINTHIILKNGSEASAAVNYPDDILGNYTVDYYDIDGNVITGSDMDSCSNTTRMVFNNADANTNLAFTSGNALLALHSVTSDSSVYVHTYNPDATVTNPATYSIACWVISNSGTQVTATVYPNECIQSQTSTSVAYGGQKFVFTPRYTCPLNQTAEETGGLAGWLIAIIVLGVLALIFIIIIIILYILYMRKQRHIADSDPEKNTLKEERNSSPDSLQNDDISKDKRQILREEGLSGFDEKGLKYPFKPRDKLEREHTFGLKEVKRPTKKLQDGKPPDKDVKPPAQLEPVLPLTEVQPGKKPTQVEPQPAKKSTPAELPPGKKIPPIELPPEKKQPPIEFPPGKKPIPPTTPKPEPADSALIRIKKERERKEKERLEKKNKEQKAVKVKEEEKKKEDTPRIEREDSKVIKNVRQSSSSEEYETDESEKEERMMKLLAKRKRLAAATYQPPDGLSDAKVVGKKKRRTLKEGEDGGDLTKSLTTREQQEIQDIKRRHRKKAMKNMAKQKFKASPSDMETSDSEADASANKRRFKRRKKGDPHGVEAPYTEQYHAKKGIEKELDDIDYWQEKVQPTVISDDDEEFDEKGNVKKKAIKVAPVDTAQAPTGTAKDRSESRLQQIMEEEADVWAAHGLKGFKLGRGGELPEGFHFDDQGNIVRDVDGKVIPKEAFARLMEMRKKFGFVFSLPRLIRDSDGRPLGGYKDDEFGPTAEWDYGLPSNTEDEDELKRSEAFKPGSGRQVAFSVQDGQSVQAIPLDDSNYSQIKGRQLGSAERSKLKDRLFESQQSTEVKSALPVFFAGPKGGVKPESVYISNAQIERQGAQAKGASNRVVRSDTFDDGRGMRRNTKARATWSGRERIGPSIIPENAEAGSGVQGISRGNKNVGSDDEFILVGGSMQKINKPYSTDSHLASHWCSRYERHGNLPIREETEMSDLNMRTAPNSIRPFSGDDKRMKKLLQELYTDKKYFDHYLEAEKLPTMAAVETRGLASHGKQFLRERAEYWGEHQPVIPVQPPSELGLRLSRMRTFHTNVDSGMDSMITPTPGRPHSADDAQETERTRRENSDILPPPPTNRSTKTVWTKEVDNTERKPPTGRSEAPPSPSKLELGKKEKSVTIDESPRKITKLDSLEPKANDASKTNNITKGEEETLPRNVLTVTDT